MEIRNIDEIHERAMELADEASLKKIKGKEQDAIVLFKQAAELEMEAANQLPIMPDSEPSRSILFRSAASLAYDAEDYKLADRLVAGGLAGYPPIEIEKELKDLYEDINFMRHAEAEGIEIDEKGLVLTLAGNATYYGGTLIEHIVKRLDRLQKEFYRTVERLLGLEFRINQRVDSKIRDKFNLYLDTQFASSFGVYLLVGSPKQQMSLFPELEVQEPVDGKTVIREVVSCLQILESAHPEALKDKIQDEQYYDDFVSFAKFIAPDGEQIKTVSLRSGAFETQRALILRKTRRQIRESIPKVEPVGNGNAAKPLTLSGYLKRANTPTNRSKFGTVGLDSFEFGRRITIKVPIALMKDTVQPYYEEEVTIIGYEMNGQYYLEDVHEYQEESNDI